MPAAATLDGMYSQNPTPVRAINRLRSGPLLLAICVFSSALLASGVPEPRIVRQLSAEEMAPPLSLEFVLRLRGFDELAAKVNSGETLSVEELKAKHLPTREAWATVAEWARKRGYRVTEDGPPFLSVRTEATPRQAARDLRASFALMESAGEKTVTAISNAPIPAEIADHVVAIEGLRPRPKARAHQARLGVIPFTADNVSLQLLNPHRIRQAYNVPPELDGEGQTIVIIGTGVKTADLVEFWRRAGLPCTPDQFSEIFPYGAPTQPRPAEDYSASEATKDVQIASAIAPRAKYLLVGADMRAVARVLIERAATDRSMGQMSMSFGITERAFAADDNFLADTQQFAMLAAIGITSFASSGDSGSGPSHGSEPLGGALGYVPSVPASVEYPASDPFVTGVGGTVLRFRAVDAGQGRQYYDEVEDERGWTLPSIPGINVAGYGASGGGTSRYFNRPSWQVGASVPNGLTRSVPDVAAPAEADPLVFAYYQASTGRVDYAFGGTSMSAPIWAGLNALLNQARRRVGLPHVGLLNAHIYRLAGVAFRNPVRGRDGDVPGTNGAHRLAEGYNLVTGLGSPDMAKLIGALTATTPPAIVRQPVDQTTPAGGGATFETAATGHPLPTIRWALNGAVIADGRLPDGTVVSGASGPMLSLSAIGPGFEGATLVMTATNTAGSVSSRAACLSVTAPFRRPSGFAEALLAPVDWQAVAGLPSTAYRLQWLRNGVAIPGATAASYVATQPGAYSVTLTNRREPALNASVAAFAAEARMVNLSARTQVLQGESAAFVGFVLAGSLPKQLLVRAIGPTLADFQISGALAAPSLTLYRGDTALATAGAWNSSPTSLRDIPLRQATAADMATVGAFALPPQSQDAAFVATLPPGSYTARIAGGDAGGVALTEIYEMSPKDPATMANLSIRAHVSAGEQAAFVGIVTQGAGTFLIRAVGPSLSELGVATPLRELTLTLRDERQSVIATNGRWQDNPIPGPGAGVTTVRTATPDDMQHVGAFALPAGSLDAAMMVTLPQGAYTAEIAGAGGQAGVVLVEAYQMP